MIWGPIKNKLLGPLKKTPERAAEYHIELDLLHGKARAARLRVEHEVVAHDVQADVPPVGPGPRMAVDSASAALWQRKINYFC